LRLHPVSAEKLIKALSKLGFKPVRQRGSHIILKHADGRVTVVPMHRGEEISRGLLRRIAWDARLTSQNLMKIIREDP